MTVQLAIGLAILLVLFGGAYWLWRRGRVDQALKETKERLKAQVDAQDQERREREAFDEAGRTDLGPTPGVRVRPKDSGTS